MTEPEKIEFERVLAGLGCMGIEDAKTIRRVVVEPFSVTVERYRHNEHGYKYIEPGADEPALDVTVIPIDYAAGTTKAEDLR